MFVVNLQSRHSKDYFKLEVGGGLFEYIYTFIRCCGIFCRLTSWVIRIFKYASFQDWENLFYIEPQIFTRSVEWILRFQTDTGSFTETAWYYSPLDTKMQGKVWCFYAQYYICNLVIFIKS
jgi:hypothetical protein